MFESWYAQHDEKTKFWLEFQVISDGLTAAPSPAAPPSTTTAPPPPLEQHQPPQPPSPPSTPQTFHPFPYLPFELRLKIWEELLQPRIILAACFDSRFAAHKRSQLALRPSLPPTPVLLLISRETRALALRHYELSFAWKLPPRLASPEAGALPTSGPARVWFNFRLDALLLMGELEPFDQYGFNSPMVYFLRREDCKRVRHVAVAYEELHLGVYESEQIFGSLFHVVDRFPGAERLLVTSTLRDAETRHLVLPAADNVIQKVWLAWVNGTSIVTSSLASKQILMIREDDLADFVAHHS
ncbi:hypothetical protein QBC34DRAFT_460645 [Podospora aff. communis PSN243]|uniref:2EXR domain-containing protein n=1 Tax=Podospora aff. communis PSN243 TaxID=3040156 RepID=A0AAV9H851_9PEZI|nr:hypothetical protein QBC34DRAFT_460645 [Podospora aff. communis PSN243]